MILLPEESEMRMKDAMRGMLLIAVLPFLIGCGSTPVSVRDGYDIEGRAVDAMYQQGTDTFEWMLEQHQNTWEAWMLDLLKGALVQQDLAHKLAVATGDTENDPGPITEARVTELLGFMELKKKGRGNPNSKSLLELEEEMRARWSTRAANRAIQQAMHAKLRDFMGTEGVSQEQVASLVREGWELFNQIRGDSE